MASRETAIGKWGRCVSPSAGALESWGQASGSDVSTGFIRQLPGITRVLLDSMTVVNLQPQRASADTPIYDPFSGVNVDFLNARARAEADQVQTRIDFTLASQEAKARTAQIIGQLEDAQRREVRRIR